MSGEHVAVIKFNCQLEQYVKQKLSGIVKITGIHDDSSTEEYTVTIDGQINAG